MTFCDLLGLNELVDDPRFRSNPLRSENYLELRPLIAEKMLTKTAEEWQAIFDENGIPSGPINTVDKVLENPQVIARHMIEEIDHPVAGKTRIPGIPIKLSRTPGEITKAAPLLGADTEKLLGKYLGYDAEKIAELREKKAI